jgi:hypothetical protein
MATKKGALAVMGPNKAEQARWQAEDDLRTMQRMAELKSNPARIRAAESLLNKQMQMVKAIRKK